MGVVIDVHTHMVPQHIPGRSCARAWPSVEADEQGNAAILIDGKVFRRVDSRCWDMSERLIDMEAQKIDVQVLSPMPELLSHWMTAVDAEYLAAHINESIAGMIAQAPDRFRGLGMVCAQDTSIAVRQLEDIRKLGLSGIEIGTHINGVALGDERLHPIYEAAEALGLGIFIHPLHPAGLERIAGGPEFAPIAAFPLETAFAATSLLANGVPTRYSQLRLLFSHGGGALPWILPRMDVGWAMSPVMQSKMPQRPSEIARSFWFDSVVFEEEMFRFMERTLGRECLVLGSDAPFLLGQQHPVDFVTRAIESPATVLYDNALAFLDGRGTQPLKVS